MFCQIVTIFSKIFGEVYSVVIISIFGFVFVDRKIFRCCLYLMMLTMIYNTILKNIFQMLPPKTCPSINFGFPSGHSHFISVFYIWVVLHYKNNILRVLCLLMIMFLWYSMVYLGFHYAFDACVASVFALCSVLLYKHFIEEKGDFYKISLFSIMLAIFFALESGNTLSSSRMGMISVWGLLVCYTFLTWFFIFKRRELDTKLKFALYIILITVMCYAVFFRTSMITSFQPRIYVSLYFMIGLFFGEKFAIEREVTGFVPKVVSVLIMFVWYSLLKYLFGFLTTDMQFFKQTIWFFFAFSIPFSSRIASVCFRK